MVEEVRDSPLHERPATPGLDSCVLQQISSHGEGGDDEVGSGSRGSVIGGSRIVIVRGKAPCPEMIRPARRGR